MLELNKIYQGDCLEIMKSMPDKSVDLVLTDPPYGIGVQNNFAIGGRNDKLKDESVNWDDSIPSTEFFKEMERVSKEQIIWGANYFNCFSKKGGAIVWNKRQPLPTASQCEIASYSGLKKVFMVTERWTNFVNSKETDHPTEKPVDLMCWCMENFSKIGDTILDPFLGSGTTAVAAKQLKRNYIGIEISKEYCKIAEDRIRRCNPLL